MSEQRPIRVLELRSVWGTGGGPEKTILLGAARTDPTRYAVTVCYLRDARDPVFGVTQRLEGLSIDYVEILERHSYDPRIWTQLRQIIRDRQIDIVHAHDYKTNLLTLAAARIDGILPLSTVHGWTGNHYRERVYYYVDKRILARFPRVIAVSTDIKNTLVEAGASPERISVILNGIDHRAFVRDGSAEAEARRRLGLPADRIIIGAVGRAEDQKRFDVLMHALARLLPRHPRLFLAIAGDGSRLGALDDLRHRLGLESSCVLLGHQSDVRLVHHAIDMFVQASDYEGTPNAVLEAMALGSPLVATDAGGTGELVRDGIDGVIVSIGDLDGLVAAIESVVNDRPAAVARAASARHRIEHELSFDTRMKRLDDIYDELFASRGLPAATRPEKAIS